MPFPDQSHSSCKHRFSWSLLKFWTLLLISLHVAIGLLAAIDGPVPPKVDPRVWEDTAYGRTGNFLVVMSEQTDTAGSRLDGKMRRRWVVAVLRETAERTQPAVRALLQTNQASYRSYWIVNMIAVEGKRGLVEALARRPDVKAIESDRSFRVPLEQPDAHSPAPASPQAITSTQPGLVQIRVTDLWAAGITGQNVIYANADTGVQWNHPALQSHYRGWNGTIADHNYNWWDAIHSNISGFPNPAGYNSRVPVDDFGHGTHTMGIGVGDDGAGNQIGVAPGARWIACRNMDQGVGRPTTYIECMQFFLAPTDLDGNNPDPDRAPDCVGNSYDCPPGEKCLPDSLHAALATLRSAGIFMSVSAGNAGPNCSSLNTPPALDAAAITVGATTSSDQIAYFSSCGPVTIDGSNRRKPDLVAPGVSVYSSIPFNSYDFKSGTSMSAPHVAGAVALLWAAFPEMRGHVDYTESILEQSALPLTSSQGCGGDSPIQVPNNVFGFGRIDVFAAYQLLTNNLAPPELRIVRSKHCVLLWPASATNCILESAQTLPALPNQWSTVTNLPALIDNNCVVTNDSIASSIFFRLRCPVP